jgi:hypothetical protein
MRPECLGGFPREPAALQDVSARTVSQEGTGMPSIYTKRLVKLTGLNAAECSIPSEMAAPWPAEAES